MESTAVKLDTFLEEVKVESLEEFLKKPWEGILKSARRNNEYILG